MERLGSSVDHESSLCEAGLKNHTSVHITNLDGESSDYLTNFR
jgi:hypothetical protein